jgi:hypothetical protein
MSFTPQEYADDPKCRDTGLFMLELQEWPLTRLEQELEIRASAIKDVKAQIKELKKLERKLTGQHTNLLVRIRPTGGGG